MKKFAVIGDPIRHSLSPLLHNWVFQNLNLDASYEKIHVVDSALSEYVNKIRSGELAGINITIPHKTEIMQHVDIVNPRGKLIGSINHLMGNDGKIIGNNTDWYGFILALKKNNIDLNQKEIILLGAGGVSKGIIFALKQEGASKIHLFNRTFERISQLCDERIHPHKLIELENIIKNDSIIVNCTSVGMATYDSVIDSSLLSKNQTVIDTIYTPLKTKLILDAESIDATTMTGLDMFIYQGLLSQDLWLGKPISNEVNFYNLKHYIESKLC